MGCERHKTMREKAIELRLAGYSRPQIAKALGLRADNSSLDRYIKDLPRPEWTKRPNAKDELRERCIALRREGMAYGEIAARTGASKGSLSLWLRDVPLTEKQRIRLIQPSREAIQRRADALRARRLQAEQRAMSEAAAEIRRMSKRDLFIAGVVVYWAEGAKSKPWRHQERVAFINSDPRMIRLFLAWLDQLGIRRDRLIFRVHIHESADVERAVSFWTKFVGAPAAQFRKTTLKRHNPTSVRKNVGRNYVGCLTIVVRRSTDLYRRIAGWYEGIMRSLGSSETGITPPFEGGVPGSTPGSPAHSQSTLFEAPAPYQCRQAG